MESLFIGRGSSGLSFRAVSFQWKFALVRGVKSPGFLSNTSVIQSSFYCLSFRFPFSWRDLIPGPVFLYTFIIGAPIPSFSSLDTSSFVRIISLVFVSFSSEEAPHSKCCLRVEYLIKTSCMSSSASRLVTSRYSSSFVLIYSTNLSMLLLCNQYRV